MRIEEWMHDWGYFGAHWAMMGLFWLFWLLVVVAIVLGIASLSRRSALVPGPGPDDSPETILKRRYARGEIDREEFERRLNDLRR